MSSSATEHQHQQQQILCQGENAQPQSTETESPLNQQHQSNLQYSLSQISIQESWTLGNQATIVKKNSTITNSSVQGEWLHPTSAQLIGYHDCRSIANAWGLGTSETASLEGPTGASQAQSPSEDDCGDGKSNELLASCPAFRNELGNEPIRHVALTRHQQQMPILYDETKLSSDWHREHTAAEIGVLEDVSNVYLGGYKYQRNSKNSNSWRCGLDRKCRATAIVTEKNGKMKGKRNKFEHFHDPVPGEQNAKRKRCELKELIQAEPRANPGQLIAKVRGTVHDGTFMAMGSNNALRIVVHRRLQSLALIPIQHVHRAFGIIRDMAPKEGQMDKFLAYFERTYMGPAPNELSPIFPCKLCAERQPKIVVEPQDMGSYYFRHCFVGRPHVEYCGNDESLGPVVISMVREEIKEGSCQHTIYRLIVRISDILTMRVAIPEEALSDNSQDRSTRNLMRELLEIICPQVHFGSLRPAINIPKVEEMLLKIDEQPIYRKYKVGVLYCKKGQQTEEQMYNNENASPNFEEFLDFLGMRVRLKGFEGYKGGLDTKSDTTGQYSIYTEHHNSQTQIMFHVSTFLPFSPNNKQQLARKRHIGNDMVTIIFQEPESLPFSPITVRSHFQHVFIIIQCCNPLTENLAYKVAISRAKDVPAFGPPLSSALYQKNAEFHDFLIHKIINAENAVLRSRKFASMAARTRREALKEMVENYSATHHTNEGASRIASRLLGGSSIKKSKERIIPKPVLDSSLKAALSWQVEFLDHSLGRKTTGVLGLSADNLVLLDVPSGLSIFSCPTHSILGWIQTADGGLKIFYDHFNMVLLWCLSPDGSERELGFLLKRLVAVTNGDEAKEVILRKSKPSESYFGFNMQEEGIVTEVDMNKSAWRQGIRQGSRILELESKALIQYRADQISELLNEKNQLKVTMLSPGSDGNPRRGCEDPSCPAIKGLECQPVLTPDIFNRHSTYLNTQSTDQDKHFHQKRQQPPRISAPSDSWSGPHPFATTLSAISDRKKHSAPAFGEQKRCEGPLTKSSFDSTGYNAFKGQLQYVSGDGQKAQNGRQLFNQASSDDIPSTLSAADPPNESLGQGPSLEETLLLHSMTTQAASSTAPLSHPETSDGQQQIDHGKCKWWLQKTLKEKRDLEVDLQTVKAQLTNEQRLHEITKRNLSIMTEYCQRFSIIPPAFEEEEDEEL